MGQDLPPKDIVTESTAVHANTKADKICDHKTWRERGEN
jgi:hypothetical protein